MADYAIIVEFMLKANTRARFRHFVDANAVASVSSEPGCHRFDVLEPQGDDDRVVLYETYRDRSAFEDHLKTPHYAAFEAAVAELVTNKVVSEYALVWEATAHLPGEADEPAPVIAE